MEAKLASMAKRKPADEDYVPGMGIDSLYVAPVSASASASASGSVSPMPGGVDYEMTDEGEGEAGELGMEEGAKAAEDLERELKAELLDGDAESTLLERRKGEDEEHGMTGKTTHDSPSIPLPHVGLPPKPAFTAAPPPNPMEAKVKAREEAFKKGLAGLPRKPLV